MIDSIRVIQRQTVGGRLVEILDLPTEHKDHSGQQIGWVHYAAGPVWSTWGANGEIWNLCSESPTPDDPDNLALDT